MIPYIVFWSMLQFYLNLAECTLRICPFKASTWPSLWSYQTSHCLFCDIKWGKPIEIPSRPTQGTKSSDCLFICCHSIYVLCPFLCWIGLCLWDFVCEMQEAIEKLLIWSVIDCIFSVWWASWIIVVAPLEALTDEVVVLLVT